MDELFLQKKWIETSCGNICYFTGRKFENKPTVLFLHGLSSNHTTWKAIVKNFEKLNLNFILPDLRGHGHSDKTKKKSRYKFSALGDDLKQIIEKENLRQAVLVGYSYGGFIALDFAIRYPSFAAGLILISANHVNPLKYRKINFLTPLAHGALNLAAWLLLWQKRKNYYYFDQDSSRGYWDSTFKGFTTMPLSVNFWFLAEVANLDFSQKISQIACPALIVKSKSDPFLSLKEAQDMARQIKNSKIITLEEDSHFLASRYQEKISALIIDFLKEHSFI